LPIEAHLELPPQGEDRRHDSRRRLHLRAGGATRSGAPVNATVLNLSEGGLLLQSSTRLSAGESFEVDLPLAGPQVASVVWASDEFYGCRFEAPISTAAVSAAQLQGPPVAAPAMRIPPDPAETFGTRLRRLRKQRELSLVALARMLGVSKPTIWYWENDQARPRPKSIGALAAVLEVAVDELVPAEWAADVPAASSATQALNEVVRACKLQIADAAGTSPEKVDISIHL